MNHFHLPKIKNFTLRSASVPYNNNITQIYIYLNTPYHYLNQSKCVNLCPEPISYSIILYRFLVCGRTKTRLKSSTQKYSHQTKKKKKNFNLTAPSGENTINVHIFINQPPGISHFILFYIGYHWELYTINFIGYWRKLPSLLNDGMNLYFFQVKNFVILAILFYLNANLWRIKFTINYFIKKKYI